MMPSIIASLNVLALLKSDELGKHGVETINTAIQEIYDLRELVRLLLPEGYNWQEGDDISGLLREIRSGLKNQS